MSSKERINLLSTTVFTTFFWYFLKDIFTPWLTEKFLDDNDTFNSIKSLPIKNSLQYVNNFLNYKLTIWQLVILILFGILIFNIGKRLLGINKERQILINQKKEKEKLDNIINRFKAENRIFNDLKPNIEIHVKYDIKVVNGKLMFDFEGIKFYCLSHEYPIVLDYNNISMFGCTRKHCFSHITEEEFARFKNEITSRLEYYWKQQNNN